VVPSPSGEWEVMRAGRWCGILQQCNVCDCRSSSSVDAMWHPGNANVDCMVTEYLKLVSVLNACVWSANLRCIA
jgi:hypothetical protein